MSDATVAAGGQTTKVVTTMNALGLLGFPMMIPLITAAQYLLTAIKNLTSRDVYLSTGVLDGYKDTETEV